MPFHSGDARRHTRQAKSGGSKRQWAAIANRVMKRGESEGSAVRIANANIRSKNVRRSHRGKRK